MCRNGVVVSGGAGRGASGGMGGCVRVWPRFALESLHWSCCILTRTSQQCEADEPLTSLCCNRGMHRTSVSNMHGTAHAAFQTGAVKFQRGSRNSVQARDVTMCLARTQFSPIGFLPSS
jgi:hypothetical protein